MHGTIGPGKGELALVPAYPQTRLPVEEIGTLRPLTPSAPDGLDLTLEQARALSRIEFRRLFDVGCLDEVPIVGGIFLAEPPPGATWYLRLRPAAAGRPRAKFELVELAPGAANPHRRSLKTDQPDEARLRALVRRARDAGRRRRGVSMSPEEVENLRVVDVLGRLEDEVLKPALKRPYRDQRRERCRGYLISLRHFKAVFGGERCIGDLHKKIQHQYYDHYEGLRAVSTMTRDLNIARAALNDGLSVMGVRSYVVKFDIDATPRVGKPYWKPEWYDRLIAAAEGAVFAADGSVTMRRDAATVAARAVWRRAIAVEACTGSRFIDLRKTTWDDPTGPWLEADSGVLFRKGWAVADKNKKRGRPCALTRQVAREARRWLAEDTARGFHYVFHQVDGTPYSRHGLSATIWRQIREDAGVPAHLHPYSLKDLAFERCIASGLTYLEIAEHLSVTINTLNRRYGPEVNWAALETAAAALSDEGPWRAAHERIRLRFEAIEASARRRLAPPAPPAPTAALAAPAETGATA